MDVIRDLRAHGIHCTSVGADRAARSGHVDVVRDLRAHGIHCTSVGADWAAMNDHLDVIRDLRAHDIHCTFRGMVLRSEEHTSELQSLLRISYAVFCLTKKKKYQTHQT